MAAEPASALMHLSQADLHVMKLLPKSRAIQQEREAGILKMAFLIPVLL